MYVETLLPNNDFDKEFIRELDDVSTKRFIVIEGGIGAGKTFAMTHYFDKDKYVKVYEPIEEINQLLKKFYANEIDAKDVSTEISNICNEVVNRGVREAKRTKKSIVIERAPWTRNFVFFYPSYVTAESVCIAKREMVLNIEPRDKKIFDLVKSEIGEPYEENIVLDYMKYHDEFMVHRQSSYFDIYQLIILNTPLNTAYNRVLSRKRDCEMTINRGYMELIKMRTLRLARMYIDAMLEFKKDTLQLISEFELAPLRN